MTSIPIYYYQQLPAAGILLHRFNWTFVSFHKNYKNQKVCYSSSPLSQC